MLRPSRPRLALQLAAGSVVVHELRYRLGPEHGERTLGDHGHAYLTVLTPLLGLVLALAAAHFLWSVWTRRPEALGDGRMSVWALAPAVLAVHVGQETLEHALAFRGPLDLGAALADGGWIAAPLSLAVAVVLSCLTHGARRLARAVLARARTAHRSSPPASGTPAAVLAITCAPLARHGAERAPPRLGI